MRYPTYLENRKQKDITIELSQCLDCEDKPLMLNAYYKNDLVYSTDMRPEEYDDLDNKIYDCLEMIKDYKKEHKIKWLTAIMV